MSSPPEILLVEDDDAIAFGLVRVLGGQGYAVQRLSVGGRAAAAVRGVALVILDLSLPDIDGIEVCRRLRHARPELGILILSARDHELDVVAGLDAGADDYLVKPFRLSELLARVRAHVRRISEAPAEPAAALQASGVVVDLGARRAWGAGKELSLRPKEVGPQQTPCSGTLPSATHRALIKPCHSHRMRVLIVEDEIKMAGLIRRGLREEGLAVDVAIKGEDALWMAEATEYDAIVLDVMLPGIDGFQTCVSLREASIWAPVLMLTARDAIEDRVAGLDGGADDYLTKPFSFAELLARLRALVRRGPVERPQTLEVADLRLDPATRQVWRGETEITLSQKEFALLETFMRRPGEVLSRYQLLEHAWDYDYENKSNVIAVYVGYLRDKIDRPFGSESIETVRGSGYRLRQAPAS